MCITPCFCDTANQDREQAAVEAKACRAEEAIVLAEMFGYRFHIKSHAVADFSPSSHRDICNAQASEALAAAGLPAAVRKALDFEHELAKLTHGQGPRATAAQLMSHAVCVCVCMCERVQDANSGCHGASKACSELQRAQRLASVGVFKNQDGDGWGRGFA